MQISLTGFLLQTLEGLINPLEGNYQGFINSLGPLKLGIFLWIGKPFSN